MKHRTLFTALAIGLMAAAGASAAEPAASPQRAAKPVIDANGDGVIDRAEAAKFPRLAQRFDQLDRDGDGRLDASERPRHGHGWRGGKGGHRGHLGGRHYDPARLDANGDGRLDRAEVQAADGRRGRGGKALLEHFDAIDANRDGYLVRGEIRGWQEREGEQRRARMQQRFDQRFAEADLNGDGRLSRVEVDEKMPRLAKRFAWMDDNRDGFLSREELRPARR